MPDGELLTGPLEFRTRHGRPTARGALPASHESFRQSAHPSSNDSRDRCVLSCAQRRVFGSAARGANTDGGDIDLLVDSLPGATSIDLGALQVELEEALGLRVDLLTPGDLPAALRERVLREAVPVLPRAPVSAFIGAAGVQHLDDRGRDEVLMG